MAKPADLLVLVVDDEEDILRYLGAALEDAGFRVKTATSGRAALELVRAERPDFVSLDLVMPGGSGIGFLHELRRHREWINIPVMLLTGHARDELGRADLENALDGKLISGPGAYLEKPVTPQRYVAAVCEALGLPAPEASAATPAGTRAEVERMLAGASPEMIAQVAAMLRGGRGGGGGGGR